MEISRTIQIEIREPIDRKKKLLKKAMDQFCLVANKSAERMPSVQNKYKHPEKFNCFYKWWQEFRDRYNLDLYAQTGQQAVNIACESYESMIENGNYDSIPRFKGNIIRFHNQQIKFKKNNGTIYFEAPILKSVLRILLPLKGKRYQYKFLKQIEDGDLKKGRAGIKKYQDGTYRLNLSYSYEREVEEEYDTIMGVDLGIRNIATVVVINKEGKVQEVRFFSGNEAEHKSKQFYKKMREFGRKGLKKKVKEYGGRKHRYMDDLMHRISKEIVGIAKEYNSLTKLEDLPLNIRKDVMEREGIGGEKRRRLNKMLSGWNYGKLRDYINYKAKEKGLVTTEVNPKNTSRKCPKCGHIEEDNRNGARFRCQECGYQADSDFIGAMNIAKVERGDGDE